MILGTNIVLFVPMDLYNARAFHPSAALAGEDTSDMRSVSVGILERLARLIVRLGEIAMLHRTLEVPVLLEVLVSGVDIPVTPPR